MKTIWDLKPELTQFMEDVLKSDRDYMTWRNATCADMYEKKKRKTVNTLVEYLIRHGLGRLIECKPR